jgi:transposase
MSDAMTELFTAALGLSTPWRVEQVRFAPEAHEIHFDVVCDAKRLPCPNCAAPDQPIHDRLMRDWQHLHFFQYRALIHAAVPRVRCSVCAAKGDPEVRQIEVPWARERSGFSLLFEAMVVTLAGMSRMPVRQIGALLGVNEARLWRSLGALVDAAYAKADMRGVVAVGIDEKHVGRGRVVTVVHDGSGDQRGRVLHVSEGCKAENVAAFADALRTHGGDPATIERCTMDMAKSYIAGVRDHLPNAQACFDPFHMIKLANEALEVVRRAEVGSEPALKRTRYHWLKDASNWTRKEIDLHWLRHKELKTARAWRMKERLRDILTWRRHPHIPVVMLMDAWIGWARRSRLPAFKRLAKTFKVHIEGIRHMLTHANSNGTAESINADIQGAIARARGFRTFRNLRTIVYLLKGKLDLPGSPYRPAVSQAT